MDIEPDSFGLIHADTNLTNWLFHQKGVALLDVESCCYGYYMFDIGRLLHELEQLAAPNVNLVGSFQRSYLTARPTTQWRDEHMLVGKLMSLGDSVLWALTLEPNVRHAWGEYRIQGNHAPGTTIVEADHLNDAYSNKRPPYHRTANHTRTKRTATSYPRVSGGKR